MKTGSSYPTPNSCSSQTRVVITGMGAVTALGHTVQETWERLLGGQSGIDAITLCDDSKLPVHIAGEVKDFDAHTYLPPKEARKMARASHLAIAATQQAVEDAKLPYPFADGMAERTGVLLGTTMGGFDKAEQGIREYLQGWSKVTPFSLAMSSPNLSTFHVCVKLNAQGYTNTVSTACSAGTVAVADAAEVIKRGRCDVIIAGGTEANINEITLVGFVAMRALSTRNGDPRTASRPFDADRDGFVLGEGTAIFVLERLEHALARNARIYAEVLGSAHSSDTYHIAAPDPNGSGAIRAMKWAIEDAGVALDEINYINAHGPSTPLGDFTETRAIKSLFGERAYQIPISSTKSMLGHSFAGAGAIEAMACVKSIETGFIHPTINYHTLDPKCDLDYVPNQARQHKVNVALSNSFGLGGQNSSLVLGKYKG